MIKTQYHSKVFLICIILFSCSSPGNNDTIESKSVTIKLEDSSSEKFESIFSIEELVAISGSEGIPVKQIKRILSIENNYWILTTNNILRLDAGGILIDSISKVGNGPGEFQSVDDIRWNESSQLIEVLDKNNGKLLRFNSDGEFQDQWSNPYLYLATSFIPIKDDYYIYGGVFFNGDGDRAVLVSGKTGEKKKGFSKIGSERNYLSVLNNDAFFQYNEDVEFFYSDSDTIFTISEFGSKGKYVLDFGKFQTPPEFFDQSFDNIMDFRNQAGAKDYASVFSIQPTDKHFFLFIIQGSKFYTAILERSTNKVRVINDWSNEFGREFGGLSSYFIYTPIGSDGQFLYFSIDPYLIKSEIDKLNENPVLPKFLNSNLYINRIYQDFDKYENPYILKIKVK